MTMRKFKNVNTGLILTENELDALNLREYTTEWNDENPSLTVQEFKEEGLSLNDYIKHRSERGADTEDFV
jgi:hypothetical protein